MVVRNGAKRELGRKSLERVEADDVEIVRQQL
jgi:hypothetical protein